MSWPEVSLGDIAEFRNGLNYTKDNEGEGLRIINVKDFGDKSVPNYEDLAELNPNNILRDEALLKDGDIIFVRSNGNKDLVGRSLFIIDPPGNVSFSAFCIRVRLDKAVNPRFYAYFFRTPNFRKKIALLGRGTNISNLNQQVLKSLIVPNPQPETKSKVVDLISSYDDLIENNRRRIALLEQAARMLYREWFVRLRFPGHEHVRMEDGVPEGWDKVVLSDLIEINKGKNITKDSARAGYIPVVAGGLQPAYFHDTANAISPVITISASGANAGFVNLYHEDIWASDCSYISSESTDRPYYFYLHLNSRQREIVAMQKGAAQPHVYPKDLMRLPVISPPESLIDFFEGKISSSFLLISNLVKQNKSLAKARDLLLPRLMNGEIPV
jgi:type I restriction enzyme S subunit